MKQISAVKRAEAHSHRYIGRDYPESRAFLEQLGLRLADLHIMATTNPENVRLYRHAEPPNLVNLERLNDARHINKFLESANQKLADGGLLIGFFESKEQRKRRIFQKYPALVAFLFYYLLDFPWKRIFPKVPLLHKIYYGLSKGHNRVISRSEVLGRLVSCGFDVVEHRELGNKTFFCARKQGAPAYDEAPTYGPFIRLERLGRYGKTMPVYKLRTMHPYAEYLQEYVYRQNRLQQGGKFKDDFRVTNWARWIRSLWLDELPMLYNWLRGDLKLVGVRPLSRHYFELYPAPFRFRRMQYKPGLIPPFYAHMPGSLEEIMASERKYLMEYDKRPLFTDLKYLGMALYNILIRRARSS